ncbi:hypothetical protein D3C77_743800 [compost metagenome]
MHADKSSNDNDQQAAERIVIDNTQNINGLISATKQTNAQIEKLSTFVAPALCLLAAVAVLLAIVVVLLLAGK